MKTSLFEIDKLDLQVADGFNKDQKAILTATLATSVKHGLVDTPISQISQLSGVSIGTMYQNFENRADLLSQLYVAIKRQYYTTIAQQLNIPALQTDLNNAKQNKEKQIAIYQQSCYHLWQYIYDFFITHVAHYLYLNQCITADVLNQSIIEASDAYASDLLAFFEIGKQLRILKPIEPRCILYIAYGNVTSMIRLQYLFKDLPTEQLETAKSILWDGLVTKDTNEYDALML